MTLLPRSIAPVLASCALLLSACSSSPTLPVAPVSTPQACPSPTVCQACAACPAPQPVAEVPPHRAASWTEIDGWRDDDPSEAWSAFRKSCNVLEKQAPWQASCKAARQLGEAPGPAQARAFFERHFSPWQLVNPDGSEQGLITGYYEPLIKASRTPDALYRWPVHGTPGDLLTIDLASVYPELKGYRLRGRLVGNKVLPYWKRDELGDQGSRLPAPVLLWAADPIDLFFMQVQGSGRAELPDGSVLRLGYADQNGHPYQSIGRWLVQQGQLSLDKASMDGIRDWARRHPQRLEEMLNSNPSYVFFRELPSSAEGPIGAQGAPLTANRSIAIDSRFVALGAPVFLATTQPNSDTPLKRLMIAQDTGGAIKGAVRADYFWGFGPQAGAMAGRMRQQGRMWVLLPNGMKPAAN
ncbi:murein transglycosylase A [Azoarcus olearius]|uniref:murein transglycosylase A n=1 Tax=Azoarcus sp. (strain BH72) TaxID=418699 RepID=UPI0003192727